MRSVLVLLCLLGSGVAEGVGIASLIPLIIAADSTGTGKKSAIGTERGAALSGGQRQRISLARALVHNPRLLILDEATSALDPATEAEIVRNVRELASTSGITVLAISHQPAWTSVADKILRMQDGDVTELATNIARLASD